MFVVVSSEKEKGVKSDEAMFRLALIHEEAGETEKALELYESIQGKSPDVLVNIGNIYLQRGDKVGAVRCFRRALELEETYPLAHFNLAGSLDEKNPINVDMAIVHYRRAIQLSPAYADAHYNLAVSYEALPEYAKAIDHYRLFLQHASPNDKERRTAQRRIKFLSSKQLRPYVVPKQ